jgi:hypothetical protein
MDSMIAVMREFGVYGLWGVIVYKILNIFEVAIAFLLIGWGVRLAYRELKGKNIDW